MTICRRFRWWWYMLCWIFARCRTLHSTYVLLVLFDKRLVISRLSWFLALWCLLLFIFDIKRDPAILAVLAENWFVDNFIDWFPLNNVGLPSIFGHDKRGVRPRRYIRATFDLVRCQVLFTDVRNRVRLVVTLRFCLFDGFLY